MLLFLLMSGRLPLSVAPLALFGPLALMIGAACSSVRLLPHGGFVVFGPLALLLPHGDLLPFGCRSYYKDLLLRISILDRNAVSIDPPVVDPITRICCWGYRYSKCIDPPLVEDTRSSARSVIENSSSSTTAHSNSNSFETRGANTPLSNSDNGAVAPPLSRWSRFDFATTAIDRRTHAAG